MWPSRGGRLIVTPGFHHALAEGVDVVDPIGEMAEIAAAGVDLGSQLWVSSTSGACVFSACSTSSGAARNTRVKRPFSLRTRRSLDQAHRADEKRQRRLEVGDADHGVEIFHGRFLPGLPRSKRTGHKAARGPAPRKGQPYTTVMPQAGQIDVNARLKRRTALASVAASVLMTLVKFAAGLMSGSLALLSEAAHNGVDVAASGLTYYAVREADKPADEDHPFRPRQDRGGGGAVPDRLPVRACRSGRLRRAAPDRRRGGDGRRQSSSPSARSSCRSSSTSSAGAP